MSKTTEQTETDFRGPVRETCRDCDGDNDRFPVFPDCMACRVRRRSPGAVVHYAAVQQVDGCLIPDVDMRRRGEWEDDGPGGTYCEFDVKPLSFPELSAALARVAELNRDGLDDGPDGLYEGLDVSRWIVATVNPPEGGRKGAANA